MQSGGIKRSKTVPSRPRKGRSVSGKRNVSGQHHHHDGGALFSDLLRRDWWRTKRKDADEDDDADEGDDEAGPSANGCAGADADDRRSSS